MRRGLTRAREATSHNNPPTILETRESPPSTIPARVITEKLARVKDHPGKNRDPSGHDDSPDGPTVRPRSEPNREPRGTPEGGAVSTRRHPAQPPHKGGPRMTTTTTTTRAPTGRLLPPPVHRTGTPCQASAEDAPGTGPASRAPRRSLFELPAVCLPFGKAPPFSRRSPREAPRGKKFNHVFTPLEGNGLQRRRLGALTGTGRAHRAHHSNTRHHALLRAGLWVTGRWG